MNSDVRFPQTLYPSRLKTMLLLLVSVVFVVIGVQMIRDGEWHGYLCAGFFGLCVLVFLAQLHPRAAYLTLQDDRFVLCSIFRAHHYLWVDIQKFAVVRVGGRRMVAWNFHELYQPSRRARDYSKFLCGYEAALPDTYGLKPDELADLLNQLLRQRHGY